MRGDASGLVIPYSNVEGYVKIRTDHPRARSGAKPERSHDHDFGSAVFPDMNEYEPEFIKYEAPLGSTPHVYVPFDLCPAIRNRTERLYLTEGEKKADVMCQQDQPCVSLPGVSGAHDAAHRRGAQDWGGSEWKLSPELTSYVLPDREVCLVFDTPDMEKNVNVVRACVQTARMVWEHGAVPLVGYVPSVPGQSKTGVDDYFVHAMKWAMQNGPTSYNPLACDFAEARPVGPNELIRWLAEQRDEGGWDRERARVELRRAAIWTRVWHERDHKKWMAWLGQVAKKFFVDPEDIQKMVLHLGVARSGQGKTSAWVDFNDSDMLEVCVPLLDRDFRLLVDPNGVERVFQVNHRHEATLQQANTNLQKLLHDGLKAKFGAIPPSRLLDASIALWRKEAVRLPGEPEPFCFAGDERLCFKRFDWEPTEAPFSAWEEFLSRLTDREAFMAFVWSCFEKGNRSRQYLWLRGEGQDGKSKVLGVLLEVFGQAGAAINNTHVEKGGQFFFSSLYGKRLVVYPDCKNSKFGMKEIVRNCTSGDPVPIEFKGETPFTAVLRTKLFVASNPKPEFTSQAADRSRIIYIEVAESEEKDDPTWEDRLKTELPGFLWACKRIYESACPHHGDIPLSAQTRGLLDEATMAFEEQFHDIFDGNFKEAPGESTSAKFVLKVLREHSLNNDRISDFKAWVERAHRVKYRPTKTGRLYEGMALLPTPIPL